MAQRWRTSGAPRGRVPHAHRGRTHAGGTECAAGAPGAQVHGALGAHDWRAVVAVQWRPRRRSARELQGETRAAASAGVALGSQGRTHGKRVLKGADFASARNNVRWWWTTRDKALYAQPDAGAKDLERWVFKRDKTAYAQHDQRSRILQSTARDESAYAQHGRGVVEVGGSAGLMHVSPAVMCLIFNDAD